MPTNFTKPGVAGDDQNGGGMADRLEKWWRAAVGKELMPVGEAVGLMAVGAVGVVATHVVTLRQADALY